MALAPAAALQSFLEECNYLAGRGVEGLEQLRRCIAASQQSDWVKSIPLVACVMNGHVNSTLRYLVEEVQVHTLNALARGDAPLHVAVIWGRVECATYLLAKGADPLLRNSRGSTAAEMARLRQERLEEQLADPDKPWRSDGSCIGREQISKLCAEGRNLVHLLDGVEAAGSYIAWARKHRGVPQVRRYSPELLEAEVRLALASLRALVLAGRAVLRPLEERHAIEAAALSRIAAAKAGHIDADAPLQETLASLTMRSFGRSLMQKFGEEACASLRSLSLAVESRLELKSAMGSETASRRLWKVIIDHRSAKQEAGKAGKKAASGTAAAMAAALQAQAVVAPAAPRKAGKQQHVGDSASLSSQPPRGQVRYISGVELLFHPDLPHGAFMAATFFLFGAPPRASMQQPGASR
mmetsp:Transcript_26204/g.61147  ORF Transcript_26204/g.61147 Transcript_26204/m.61147 type:complete len:411 (-) Transcript_26204:146-1378(-)